MIFLDESLQQQIPSQFRHQKFQTFYRAEIQRQIFYSEEYSRVKKKRNSYTVLFKRASTRTEEFGQIKRFIFVPGYGSFCIMRLMVPISTPSQAFELSEAAVDFAAKIFQVEVADTILVPLPDLTSKCVFIKFENKSFVAKMNSDILLD